MLSVERVKKLINDPKLSDKEIEEIRDQMYMLTEIIFEQWMEERKKAKAEEGKIKPPRETARRKLCTIPGPCRDF